MKLNQAYQILGLSSSASMDEVKSAYKKAAFEYHPDRNKDPDASKKLAEINEAYNTIKNPTPPEGSFRRAPGVVDVEFTDFNLDDIFSNIGFGGNRQTARQVPPIQTKATLTFEQSITGFEYSFDYQRQIKCDTCNGLGEKSISNGCSECGGLGRKATTSGNFQFVSTCPKCQGKMPPPEKCNDCKGSKYHEKPTNLKINIPPGVVNQNILKLQGMGHFIHNHQLFGDMYGDILLTIEVIPHPILSYQEPDVICPLSISLLEALEGTTKTVPTIKGNKKINIPPLSKNKDEISLPKLGVLNKNGNQRVILNVEYPTQNQELINFLKQGN